MNFCIKCGNPLKPNARFCGKCGETVIQVIKPEQPEPVAAPVCNSCGSVLILGVKFCTACGAPVAGNISVPPVNFPPPPVKPVKPAPPVKQKTAKKQRGEDKEPRKKRAASLLKIVAGLILFAGIAAAAWFFVFKSTSIADVVYPEYTSHPVVSGKTETEAKKINVLAGSNASIILSDSSGVFIPGLKCNAGIELERESNNIVLDKPGLKTSGYMLSITIEGTDSISASQPVITIARSQVGDINPATINMVRVSDVVGEDGSIIKGQLQYLPVTIDKAGNYTATDYMLPVTASTANSTAQAGNVLTRFIRALIPEARAQGNNNQATTAWVGHVKYSIMTFQDDVNWYKSPRLVQMTPDNRTGHFRHPSTQKERSERTAPVVNVVVLVHGHNEEEKGGDVGSMTQDIWEFAYKRDVWNYFYKYYQDQASKAASADPNKKDSCTIFYEFIYPSYRAAYSPVLGKNSQPYRTLGQDMGVDLNDELIKKNPQVAEMVKKNIPFNLFIVGHSMGGLVARAGLRYLDEKLLGNFRQLITWGTPHQGSPVTTLRYIMAAGFYVKADYLPLLTYWGLPGAVMQYYTMDTPGLRDLRWTNGSNTPEQFFDYENFFSPSTEDQDVNPDLSLKSGSTFYNDNLKKFNETEQFAAKYTFLTGNTSQIAQVKKGNWKFTKAYYLATEASDCAKGSCLMNMVSAGNVYRPNDGASPVWGQAGMDLSPRPKTIDMGDVNHQQFYEDYGEETAAKTFEVIKETANCDCPYIDDYFVKNDTISAKLIWNDDEKPGKRISRIEAVVTDKKTNKVISTSTGFMFKDPAGIFSGAIPPGLKDKDLQLMLKVTTKDGSIIEYSAGSISDINVTGSEAVKVYIHSHHTVIRDYKTEINTSVGDYIAWEGNGLWDISGGGHGYATSNSISGIKGGLTWSNRKFSITGKYSSFHRKNVYDDYNETRDYTVSGELSADNKCSIQITLNEVQNRAYSKRWDYLYFHFSLINVPFTYVEDVDSGYRFNYAISGPQVKSCIQAQEYNGKCQDSDDLSSTEKYSSNLDECTIYITFYKSKPKK